MYFPLDSDQQCDSTRISEMEGSIHETHCNLKVSSFKKRQTYNSETNKLHKMTYISSGGEFSEGKISDLCFYVHVFLKWKFMLI